VAQLREVLRGFDERLQQRALKTELMNVQTDMLAYHKESSFRRFADDTRTSLEGITNKIEESEMI